MSVTPAGKSSMMTTDAAPIVVGVDGSRESRRALAFACARARRSERSLVLVHSYLAGVGYVSPMAMLPLPNLSYYRDVAEAVLNTALEEVNAMAPDIDVTAHLELGGGGTQICEYSAPSGLVVVGRSSSSAISHAVLGSVARHVLDHARCPVAVVPIGYDETVPTTTIVVGTDGSPDADAALDWGYEEAGRTGAHLLVVHAWRNEPVARKGGPAGDRSSIERCALTVLNSAVDRLKTRCSGKPQPVVVIDQLLVENTITAAIIDAASNAQLVVMGHRGLGRLGHFLVGSVARHVADHAPCPVVVVRG
jgi:nucleotide-binding universal stress UspA family protein